MHTIGAEPVWCDAETHDWAVGVVSHLPQMLAVALAQVIRDETDETGMPLALAGSGLKDSLRLAGSPYGVWRDVALTNRENISRALDRLTQAIDHLRTNLGSKELGEEFDAANELYKRLHRTARARRALALHVRQAAGTNFLSLTLKRFPRQRMVCGKKLAAHTTKAKASRSGSIQRLRPTRSSRRPSMPTAQARAKRSTRYVPRNAAARPIVGERMAATKASGKLCVKRRPRWPSGREKRMLRFQRS